MEESRQPDPLHSATIGLLAGRTAGSPKAASVGPGTRAVAIVDTAFRPAMFTVAPSATVRRTRSREGPHLVTAADGSLDSSPDCSPITPQSCLRAGASFTHAFLQPGVYRYYCRAQGTSDGHCKSGTITVKARRFHEH